MVKPGKVIWSLEAEKDLKNIYLFCAKQELHFVNKIILEIIESPKRLLYANQYQEDEFLGLPFRRYFIRHWRVIYKTENNLIAIIRVFDTRQSPEKLKKRTT